MAKKQKKRADAKDKPDPCAEGADAALGGGSETDNPYPAKTDEHLSWNDGFMSMDEWPDSDYGTRK